jgi:biopolymer transport protein ExbD
MAFSSPNGGGYGSRRRAGGSSISEINVTPFVDVVLVLLIIFMLTASVMDFGIQVDVPKVRTVKESPQELPVVTVTKEGVTSLNGADVNINDLNAAIRQKFPDAKGVYLRADKDAVWNVPVQVMAELGEGKFQVNVVTEPEDTAAKGRK